MPEEPEVPQRVVLEESTESRMAKKGFLNRYRKQSGFQVEISFATVVSSGAKNSGVVFRASFQSFLLLPENRFSYE